MSRQLKTSHSIVPHTAKIRHCATTNATQTDYSISTKTYYSTRPITLKPIDPITPSQPKQTVPLWQMPPKPLIKPNTLIQPKEKPIIAQNPPINILKPETPKQKIYTDIPNDTPIEPGIAKSNRKNIDCRNNCDNRYFGAGGYYWSMNLLSTPSIVEKENRQV